MRLNSRAAILVTLLALGVTNARQRALLAAPETWTGTISDATCGSSHTQMAALGGFSDRECVLACTERGKFVFVSNGKVIAIANQDFLALKDFAGDTVSLTGEKKNDEIIVSKIVKS